MRTDAVQVPAVSVLDAGWVGSGSPADSTAQPLFAACARCGRLGRLAPTYSVVSKMFTATDQWADPTGPGLCSICAWGYATPTLRSRPHVIRLNPAATITALTAAGVSALLCGGALDPGLALTVPLHPGRKHLVPLATWGQIRIDNASLTWRHQDAHRLRVATSLRRQGFGTRMLTAPAPPYTVLRKRPQSEWPQLLDAWQELAVWRVPDNPWMALALHVTMAPKPVGAV